MDQSTFYLAIFGAFAFLFLGTSFFAWMIFGAVLVQRQPLPFLKPEPRRPAPWGAIDLLSLAVLVAVAQVFTLAIFFNMGWASKEDFLESDLPGGHPWLATIAPLAGRLQLDQAGSAKSIAQPKRTEFEPGSQGKTNQEMSDAKIRASGVLQSLNLVVMVLFTVWIAFRCRCRIGDLGWSFQKIGKDFMLGLGATILFLPLVFMMMSLVSYLFQKEYNHPVLEMLGRDPISLLIAVWMAVGVAPITEEFAFRVLFQGFMESLAAGPFSPIVFLLGRNSFTTSLVDVSRPALDDPSSQASPSNNLSANALGDPYEPTVPRIELTSSQQAEIMEISETAQVAWWPILVSGIVFGGLHAGYGMSWIPLMFLGFLLGGLYRLTHRIWPSFIVHFLMNAIAMTGMILQSAATNS